MIRGEGYHAIVLAAGAGTRFGGSKLTAPFEGGVLLDGALRTACAAPVESVLVVTGAHRDAVTAAVDEIAATADRPIRPIPCPGHAQGMSASLRCGLASLPADAAGAFIFLADMPRIPAAVAGRLLDALLAGSLAAIPSVGGRWGHPVLIAQALFDAFSDGGGDGGGRDTLRGLGGALAIVEVQDAGILADADTLADLQAMSRAACARLPQARN